MLQRLRSDEYYKPTKWALLGLGVMCVGLCLLLLSLQLWTAMTTLSARLGR